MVTKKRYAPLPLMSVSHLRDHPVPILILRGVEEDVFHIDVRFVPRTGLLTSIEAAALFGVARSTIYRWILNWRLRSVPVAPGRHMVTVDSCLDWLENRGGPNPA